MQTAAMPFVPSSSPTMSAIHRVRDRVLGLTKGDGYHSASVPNLCLYRFAEPSSFSKAATFGVTLGVVLQGEKRVRLGNSEWVSDPSRVVVITRESELLTAITKTSL